MPARFVLQSRQAAEPVVGLWWEHAYHFRGLGPLYRPLIDQLIANNIILVPVDSSQDAIQFSMWDCVARRTGGYTGSDIELAVTTAWRFALRDGAPAMTDAHLTAALDDLIPTARDQRTIDRMTLIALDECRNKRLLPGNADAIRKEIEARAEARS